MYLCYVDIAGAYGSFTADLLAANPKSVGVLFDQSQVGTNHEEAAAAQISAQGIAALHS